tara:strand:+ start:312 stop:767 length:456 start_codon:yes stop_codon:yes gene_type:complete
MYKFIPAQKEHVPALLENITPEIRDELKALRYGDIAQRVENIIAQANEAWSAFDDEGLICIFGIQRFSLVSDKGAPWLLTTKRVKKHKRNFLKGAQITLDYWFKRYTVLENYIPTGFNHLLKWVKWAGFTVDPPVYQSMTGCLMHRVWRNR